MLSKLAQWIRYHELTSWIKDHERIVLPATMVFGVLVDALTFVSINIITSFFLLAGYAAAAGGIIVFQHLYDAGVVKEGRVTRYAQLSAPLAIQFLFGALLSGSFIFYFFSGTVFVSWPIFALFALLMVSNDAFREYYLRPIIQLSVYFFILFSLASVILPFALRSIGALTFLLSGMVSVGMLFCFVAFLRRMAPRIRLDYRRFTIVIVLLFLCLNGLYFLNIIPPIPLVLRDAAVGHSIRRSGGGYELAVERQSLRDRLILGQTLHLSADERVAVYSAIYAPQGLLATVVHRWQYYEETKHEWVTTDRLSFGITGGVRRGYRGYSVKSHPAPGKWRVDVETERGQVMGRVRFDVAVSDTAPVLMTVVK
jgi:hypothetical protein